MEDIETNKEALSQAVVTFMAATARVAAGHVGITAAVARPLLSGLEYRRLHRSRLLSIPEHNDHCSRLQISLKISGVLGSSIFTRFYVYVGSVTHQVEYDQAIQSILCCAPIITHICDFFRMMREASPKATDNTQLGKARKKGQKNTVVAVESCR